MIKEFVLTGAIFLVISVVILALYLFEKSKRIFMLCIIFALEKIKEKKNEKI